MVHGPRAVDLGHHLEVQASPLPPRGRRRGLLGQVSGSGSIWVEGWEPMLGGVRASDLGRVMDVLIRRKVSLLRECLEATASDGTGILGNMLVELALFCGIVVVIL